MNENLENQLAEVLKKSLELAEKSGEFVIEQAPELLREFYLWHTLDYILGIVCALSIFFLTTYFFRKYGQKLKWDFDYEIGLSIASLLYGVSSIVMLLMFFYNISMLLKITVAPKLYLVEYFIK